MTKSKKAVVKHKPKPKVRSISQIYVVNGVVHALDNKGEFWQLSFNGEWEWTPFPKLPV